MPINRCKIIINGGVTAAEATPAANTLVITGTATDDDIRKAVEQAGFEYKGRKE